MASFDIVSKIDPQSLENALNTVKKEIQNRYDFKDTKGSVELDKKSEYHSYHHRKFHARAAHRRYYHDKDGKAKPRRYRSGF